MCFNVMFSLAKVSQIFVSYIFPQNIGNVVEDRGSDKILHCIHEDFNNIKGLQRNSVTSVLLFLHLYSATTIYTKTTTRT